MYLFIKCCINRPITSPYKIARHINKPIQTGTLYKEAGDVHVTWLLQTHYGPIEKTGLYKPVHFYLCVYYYENML